MPHASVDSRVRRWTADLHEDLHGVHRVLEQLAGEAGEHARHQVPSPVFVGAAREPFRARRGVELHGAERAPEEGAERGSKKGKLGQNVHKE